MVEVWKLTNLLLRVQYVCIAIVHIYTSIYLTEMFTVCCSIIKLPLATARAASCNGPVHLLVCFCVCRQNTKTRFSQKLSILEPWSLLTTCIGSRIHRLFRYWIPKIQDGGDPPSWKSTWRHFFCRGWSDFGNISQTGAEWHVNCGDMVEIETRSRLNSGNRSRTMVITDNYKTISSL